VEPCGGSGRVGGGEGPIGSRRGRIDVVVRREGGIPEGPGRGEIVYDDCGDGAGVSSWDGKVGVATNGTVDDGPGAVLGDCVVSEDLAALLRH
jgi:hypothetical protein